MMTEELHPGGKPVEPPAPQPPLPTGPSDADEGPAIDDDPDGGHW